MNLYVKITNLSFGGQTFLFTDTDTCSLSLFHLHIVLFVIRLNQLAFFLQRKAQCFASHINVLLP